MLKINRDNKGFSSLDTSTLSGASITERYDLQEFISNTPEVAFKEIGQELFLLGKEVAPSSDVQDRIDLLAMDKEGACVVVELKRGSNKFHMLQAISYAGMISQWGPDDFWQLLDEDQQDSLTDFLEVDKDDINRKQRIVLIAEAYDYALLIGAEWLSDHYGVDITCCRVSVAIDSASNSEYVAFSIVYPAPELAKEALPRGRKRGVSVKVRWPDWDTAISGITNSAVSAYFKQEISANRESYLPKRILRYRVGRKRRWNVAARKKNAYVWQIGRFDGDIEFWQSGLSEPNGVKPVKDQKCLRMFLNTPDDFQFFHDSVTNKLQSSRWVRSALKEAEGGAG